METEDKTELSRLSDMVDEMMAIRARIAQLELELQKNQIRQKDFEEVQVPSLMEQIGLTSLRTTNGFKVELDVQPKASITEANREMAMCWLEDNGHGGLIKRTVTVAFNRDQEKEARALVAEIEPKYGAVKEKKEVHPQTLQAFVKGQIAEGAALPLDLFSVHFLKRVKVSH